MLVMRRRAGESILIGDEIEIQILHIGPSRIKLGISAPRSVPVALKEVHLVGQENQAAARLASVGALRRLLDRLLADPVEDLAPQ
jgi:carbon storage regulator